MKKLFLIISILTLLCSFIVIVKGKNFKEVNAVANSEMESVERCDPNFDFEGQTEEKNVSTAVEYDTYLKNYFNGLTTNMGHNTIGSCGYVALGMILSYYDSYLDDNIVPEQYDVKANSSDSDFVSIQNSPGVKDDNTHIFYGEDEKDSDKIIKNKKCFELLSNMEDSLHAKLIMIGNDLKYVDLSDPNGPFGTFEYQRIEILEKYFEEIGITDYEIKTFNGSSQEGYREFVKENVLAGYPVLVGASGHAFIVYDYDSDNDILYGNAGWVGYYSYMHFDYSIEFPDYTGAMVLKFPNREHKHSYNYAVKHGDHIDKYCYCNNNIRTYKSTIDGFDEQPSCFDGTYTIPFWATDIKEDAFKNNTSIKEINFASNSSLGYVPDYAFRGCESLNTVRLSSDLNAIGEYAFADCPLLTTVIFDEDCTINTIGYSAFERCINLRTTKALSEVFEIPQCVEYIGNCAFFNCGLKKVNFNGDIMSVGDQAFFNCSDLTSVTFNAKVRSIGFYAFGGCTNLTTVNLLPKCDLQYIEGSAFRGCGLTHFEIPDSVTEIGSEAFYDCRKMTSVVMPASVTTLGSNVFSGSDDDSAGKLTIYAEIQEPPVWWYKPWYGNNPVFFGCTLSADKTYVEAINTELLFNKNDTNIIQPPYRNKNSFGGWYSSRWYVGTGYNCSNITSAEPGTYYTKWTPRAF